MSLTMTVLAAGAGATAWWLLWAPPAARGLLAPTPEIDSAASRPRLPPPPAGQRLLYAGVAGVAALVVIPGWQGVVAAGVIAALVHLGTGRMVSAEVRRTRRELTDELPECLSLLAGVLAAGSPLRVAVAEVASVSPSATRSLLESVAGHIQVGRGEDEAWQAVADDPVATPIWGLAARDLARNAQSGAAVVDLLRRHATDARAERAGQVEKQARTVGVHSVMPLMVCFLPAFVLVGVVPIIAGLVGQFPL